MSYEQAMEAIQKICEKLNVAAEYLVPRLAKYKITENAVLLIIMAAVIFSIVKLLRFTFKEMTERNISNSYDGWPEILFVLSCGALVILAITAAVIATEFATWIAAPEVKAIEYIIRMMK